jgi:molybdopterin-guanine dinucleotide biosynthesis protein A
MDFNLAFCSHAFLLNKPIDTPNIECNIFSNLCEIYSQRKFLQLILVTQASITGVNKYSARPIRRRK